MSQISSMSNATHNMDHRKGLTKAEPEEAQIETINFDLLL